MSLSRKPKSDLPTLLLHWGLVIALGLSLATGLRIAADMPDASWARAIAGVLPQGNVVLWHLWAAIALIAITATYVAFLLRADVWRRVALDRAWWIALTRGPDATTRLRALNVAIYWLGFLAIAVATVSGLLLDLAPGFGSFELVAAVHQWAAWSLPAYLVLHVAALFAQGGWGHVLKIFRPRVAYVAAGSVALVAGGAAAAALFGFQRTAGGHLDVVEITTAPVIDGVGGDAVWRDADEARITTRRGVNAPGTESIVTVRAVHDGTNFYGLFQWSDPTRSQEHLPLVKTDAGWVVMQTEYGVHDEDVFYEDKFGVMLAEGGGVAGDGSIHLGHQPLAGRPGAAGERGLHYTTDGGIVDVWHWKSVRTGNPVMEQIDDNYFGPPMEPEAEGRYTGGYTKDPKDDGGYTMNWEAYADDVVIPKRLPTDPSALAPFQDIDLDPSIGDAQGLFLTMAETMPYAAEHDTYPIGTILPSVLVDGPFEGDRGDVRAVARWRDGTWTMEVVRALDTGSAYDVALTPDAPVYLWVAAFDHAQTRHSQHLYPLTLEVK